MVPELTSFVLGVGAGTIFTAAIAYPRVGRIISRVLAVAAAGAGGGLLTWSIISDAQGEEMNAIALPPVLISQPSEAYGWSAGLLLAGITILVLSFVGRSD